MKILRLTLGREVSVAHLFATQTSTDPVRSWDVRTVFVPGALALLSTIPETIDVNDAVETYQANRSETIKEFLGTMQPRVAGATMTLKRLGGGMVGIAHNGDELGQCTLQIAADVVHDYLSINDDVLREECETLACKILGQIENLSAVKQLTLTIESETSVQIMGNQTLFGSFDPEVATWIVSKYLATNLTHVAGALTEFVKNLYD